MIKWLEDNRIQNEKLPRKFKKITGSRFGAILKRDKFKTDFEAWCNITRTWEEPFEESVYTLAGKIIETLQIEFFKTTEFLDVKTPEDIYGKNYFMRTWGDFYPENKILGGMWDALTYDDGILEGIVEAKTTKRAEDWENGAIPENYKIQACLYATLSGVDNIYFPVSFLTDETYTQVQFVLDTFTKDQITKMLDNGEIYSYVTFKCTMDNTKVFKRKVSELYPNFQEVLDYAVVFWNEYVLTGISPEYCEKRDAHVLKELRKNTLNPTTDINQVLEVADTLRKDINAVELTIADKQKQLKVLETQIKDYMSNQFRDGDKQVALNSQSYVYTLSRKETMKVDNDALKADGLFDKYATNTITTTLTKKEIK